MLPVRHPAPLRRHLLGCSRTLAALLATLAALGALALFGRLWALAHCPALPLPSTIAPLGWLSTAEGRLYLQGDRTIWAFHTLVLLATTASASLLGEAAGRLGLTGGVHRLGLSIATAAACSGLVIQGGLVGALAPHAFGSTPQASTLAEMALLSLHILFAVRAGHHTLALEDAASQTLNEV